MARCRGGALAVGSVGRCSVHENFSHFGYKLLSVAIKVNLDHANVFGSGDKPTFPPSFRRRDVGPTSGRRFVGLVAYIDRELPRRTSWEEAQTRDIASVGARCGRIDDILYASIFLSAPYGIVTGLTFRRTAENIFRGHDSVLCVARQVLGESRLDSWPGFWVRRWGFILCFWADRSAGAWMGPGQNAVCGGLVVLLCGMFLILALDPCWVSVAGARHHMCLFWTSALLR